MQTLNKAEQIANLQGKNRLERRNAVQDMLIAYRSTLHPATRVTPYEALKGTLARMKLDYIEPEPQRNENYRPQRRRIQAEDEATERREKDQREYSATRRLCVCQATKQGRTNGVHPISQWSMFCAAFVVPK